MQATAEAHSASWAVPAPWRVRRVRRETRDVSTLELESLAGDDRAFRPGQFNMLCPFGMGEVPISICGDPAQGGVLVHTVRDVGPVTRALCALRRGDVVGVRGPFGSDWRIEDAEGSDVVVVAGGIGLPPIRPAIYHVLANRSRYGRVIILYGARTPEDLLYPREVAAWRGRFDLDVQVTVDSASGGWGGNVGVVPDLISRARFDPDDTVALMCGPEIMMRFAIQALRSAGVPPENIRLSMERNMKCAVRMCGHCQLGPLFVCRDGPVFDYPVIAPWFGVREL